MFLKAQYGCSTLFFVDILKNHDVPPYVFEGDKEARRAIGKEQGGKHENPREGRNAFIAACLHQNDSIHKIPPLSIRT